MKSGNLLGVEEEKREAICQEYRSNLLLNLLLYSPSSLILFRPLLPFILFFRPLFYLVLYFLLSFTFYRSLSSFVLHCLIFFIALLHPCTTFFFSVISSFVVLSPLRSLFFLIGLGLYFHLYYNTHYNMLPCFFSLCIVYFSMSFILLLNFNRPLLSFLLFGIFLSFILYLCFFVICCPFVVYYSYTFIFLLRPLFCFVAFRLLLFTYFYFFVTLGPLFLPQPHFFHSFVLHGLPSIIFKDFFS